MMPYFMLLLHRPAGAPPALTPDEIAAITRNYMDWSGRPRAEGRLKAGEKLTFDAGWVMRQAVGLR